MTLEIAGGSFNNKLINFSKAVFRVVPVTPKTEWLSYLALRPFFKKGHTVYATQNHRMSLDVRQSCMMYKRAMEIFEAEPLKAVEELLGPGDIFVDAGACVGDFSLVAARRVGPRGKVLAFEPNPKNLEVLRWNVTNNGYDQIISVVPKALGSSRGEVLLAKSDSGSGDHIVSAHGERRDDHYKVEITALTDHIADADKDRRIVVKVDVEGHELEVIRGTRPLVEKGHRLAFFISLHPHLGVDPDEVFATLSSMGFQIFHPFEKNKPMPRFDPDNLDLVALPAKN